MIIALGIFSFFKKKDQNFFNGNKNIPTRNLATVTVLSNSEVIKKPKPPKPKEVKIPEKENKIQLEKKQVVNQKPKQETKLPVASEIQKTTLSKSSKLIEKSQRSEISLAVEEMPNFPGCEQIIDKDEKKSCADNKLLRFLNKNIEYPKVAAQRGIEGIVFITFIVEKSGRISKAEIIRDIGGGCGEEALRVVKTMPKWNAGKQNGKAMRVRFHLPVRFQLN